MDNFDPHKDLVTLIILPHETTSEFLLRCTIIRNKFTVTKGEPPYVRIMDKVVNCLYKAPGLSTAMATLMTSITQHKIVYGTEDNSFNFELEDIMIILKNHQIKLSHNLNPNDDKAKIASLIEHKNYEGISDGDNNFGHIAAFNANRPKCVVENKKKPFVGKGDKATFSSLLMEYLQPDPIKEVSNRDLVSISALANKYLDDCDGKEHPISLLASLENKIEAADEDVDTNANIASVDNFDETRLV